MSPSHSPLDDFPCRKDARLPVQLQRAMAAEAEAAREARAKVSYLLPSFERTTSDDPGVASMTEWQKVEQK